MPAEAGIQESDWIAACAGMTEKGPPYRLSVMSSKPLHLRAR
jgi:hypothetical protein